MLTYLMIRVSHSIGEGSVVNPECIFADYPGYRGEARYLSGAFGMMQSFWQTSRNSIDDEFNTAIEQFHQNASRRLEALEPD